MVRITIFICLIFTTFLSTLFASPRISFEQLMINAEKDPQMTVEARAKALSLSFPINILSADNIIIDIKALEDGRPVYAVITDFANPYNGGYTAFYEELSSVISFSNSKVMYADGRVIDNTQGKFSPTPTDSRAAVKVLIITESTTDRVYIFRADNGDFIDTAFIPSTRPQLQTPKHAIQHYDGKSILVSDQISDVVQRFNKNGTYSGFYAPSGGVNNAILDNIRGIRYRSNNNLLVTVGSGASTNTIQQFDPSGASLGSFITGNVTSPFDIMIRANDILVSNFSGTQRVSKFDLNGVFISSFYTGSNFSLSQQMYEIPNGNVAVASFSTPSGIAILDGNGVFQKLLTGITGNRGVYLLGNGNFLTTNGAGAHEIDSSTGALVRTVLASTNFQYIGEYSMPEPTVKLTIKYEACTIVDSIKVELRNSVSPYGLIQSNPGLGGISVPQMIEFSAASNGVPYYLLVRQRGSIAVWSGSTPAFSGNYMNYNFTYTAAQAFGGNQVLTGGKWSLYTGDANQDEIVDVSDVVAIYNDGVNFVGGYVPTDLNCDDFVDVSDLTVAYNNSINSVSVIAP